MLIKPKKKFWIQSTSPYYKSAAGGVITFTPTDAQSVDVGFGSHTFPSVNIGSASADRIVVMCQGHPAIGDPGTPTINGNPFTLAVGDTASDPQKRSAIFYASVPSGTTASIFVNPGSARGVVIAVGVLKGQSGGASATPDHVNGMSGLAADPISLPVLVTAGGIGIAFASGEGCAGAETFTWTNTANNSGDENPFIAGDGATWFGEKGTMTHFTSSATLTASSSPDSFSFGGTMVYASWAP